MIRNLLFDMGGVVFTQNTAEAFRRFREAGIDPQKYMGDHGQKDFFLDVETGIIDGEEFCRRMAQATGRDHVGWDEAARCWLGFVDGVPEDRLQELNRLRRDYRLCLLSNTNPFIMEHMRSNRFCSLGLPITHFFDALFCSYEMKAYKPHPDIFLQVLEAENVCPQECLFVDDSRKNTEAACAVGMHVLHVETNADWRSALRQCLDELNAL